MQQQGGKRSEPTCLYIYYIYQDIIILARSIGQAQGLCKCCCAGTHTWHCVLLASRTNHVLNIDNYISQLNAIKLRSKDLYMQRESLYF